MEWNFNKLTFVMESVIVSTSCDGSGTAWLVTILDVVESSPASSKIKSKHSGNKANNHITNSRVPVNNEFWLSSVSLLDDLHICFEAPRQLPITAIWMVNDQFFTDGHPLCIQQ